MLGGRRRRILLEDRLDRHIAVRHGEFVIADGHAAADDPPLLEVIAGVGLSGQGDLRAGNGGSRPCGSRAVAVIGHGDGVLGGRGFADGKVVLRLTAIVPRAAQRHLGSLCRIEALVLQRKRVGTDVVGIDDRVVCALRKRRIDILAYLMGKSRQLLFAAV